MSLNMCVNITCRILCCCCLFVACSASSWSNWSSCSVTCGEGKKVRRRPCDAFELGCNNGEFVQQNTPCFRPICGGLHCFEGISAAVGGFETINTFALRKCEDIAHAPASRDPSGRTGLYCATTIMKVERNGMKFDMIQGTCLNEDLCKEVNCDRYKKLMGLHNIESCEVRCCSRDRCNNPNIVKPKKNVTDEDNPCTKNPCQNSGSCIVMEKGGHMCACQPGFTGENCTEVPHRICHTGVSTRTAAVQVDTQMLTTTCASPTDKCMVASLASYVGGIALYVDTAQCVKPEVCDRLKCSDLKKTTKSYEIASCKIHCCSDDYCNNAPTMMPPLPTTTAYTPGTVRTTRRTTTKKPRPAMKTTRRPQTRRITPTIRTTLSTTTVDTSGPHWSQWQKWQSCTHQCGDNGTRRRYRYCMKGAPGMPGCMPQNADHEIVPCNRGISCIRWREWGNWQSCSRKCGGGTRERRRSCDGGAPNTGDCIGSDLEKEKCNVQSCQTTLSTTRKPPATPKRKTPRWGKWGKWNSCSKDCGLGTQQRRRSCIDGRIGRRGCRGKVKQMQDCNAGPCTSTPSTLKPQCFERNVAKAKNAGRKCPARCDADKKCGGTKKCVCDGMCGKTCQKPTKRCKDISSRKNQRGTKLECSSGNSVGSVCTFSCQNGYKLQGQSAVICQGTSKWTNEKRLPSCVASSSPPTASTKACAFRKKSHNSCCGNRSFNNRSAKCCKGKVSAGGRAATKCCAARPYDPRKRGCCKNKVFWMSKQKCKNGRVVKK